MVDRTQSISEGAGRTRRALVTMTDEIRQASEATEGAGAFAAAGSWCCTFYADVDRDDVPELVSYSTIANVVYRKVASSVTSAPPYDFSRPATATVYVARLINPSDRPLFRYYDENGDPAVSVADICLVGVCVVEESTVGSAVAATEMATEVKIRSLNNGLY
jgi:hypothetical protein